MEDKDRVLAGTFQCRMQVTQQREIVMTGHIYNDDTVDEINKRIDMHQDALDRQFVRCDLVAKEAQRANLLGMIEKYVDQLEKLNAKQVASQNGGDKHMKVKLTSQERQTIEKGAEQVTGMKNGIIELDSLIAAAKQKLGISASP